MMTVVAGLALATTTGCGASLEGTYEADVHFERCMALDASGEEVGPRRRRACWRAWLTSFRRGQTKDRVLHAESRVRALTSAAP
ncbi:MAG: hypothetical protein AAF715_24010 [Myxococcota bacterium]